MGARILGNTNTRIIEIQAHSYTLEVTSDITCVVCVDFTGAVGVDTFGKLGINELQAVNRHIVSTAIQLLKNFILLVAVYCEM